MEDYEKRFRVMADAFMGQARKLLPDGSKMIVLGLENQSRGIRFQLATDLGSSGAVVAHGLEAFLALSVSSGLTPDEILEFVRTVLADMEEDPPTIDEPPTSTEFH